MTRGGLSGTSYNNIMRRCSMHVNCVEVPNLDEKRVSRVLLRWPNPQTGPCCLFFRSTMSNCDYSISQCTSIAYAWRMPFPRSPFDYRHRGGKNAWRACQTFSLRNDVFTIKFSSKDKMTGSFCALARFLSSRFCNTLNRHDPTFWCIFCSQFL